MDSEFCLEVEEIQDLRNLGTESQDIGGGISVHSKKCLFMPAVFPAPCQAPGKTS